MFLRKSSARRKLWAFLLTLAIATGGASAVAIAQSSDRVEVTPSDELVQGQFVKVSWSEFPESGLVYLRQCEQEPSSADDCSPQLANGVSRADGSGTEYFEVFEGRYPGGDLTCDYKHPCSIGVFNDPEDVSTAAFTTIEYAFPATACPTPAGPLVSGSGSSAAQRAMLKWAATVCRPPFAIGVQYTLKSSALGRNDFLLGLVDYTVTATPFSEAQDDELASEGRKYEYAPLTGSGVAIGFNMRDPQSGEQITELNLTPDLVAEIFTGQIYNLNSDERVRELNPGVQFPPLLRAVGRADYSAATYTLTSFFNATAKRAYERAGQAYQDGPSEGYPSTGAIDLRTGGPPTALAIADPFEKDFTQYGYIGWVDTSIADIYGLPSASIENPAGKFVRPTTKSLEAGIDSMHEGKRGLLEPDFATDDPDAYVMPMVSYLVAPTNKISEEEGSVLGSFIKYAATDGQKTVPRGYVALPEVLTKQALDVVPQIPGGSEEPPPTDPEPPVPPATEGPITVPGGPAPGDLGPGPTGGTAPISDGEVGATESTEGDITTSNTGAPAVDKAATNSGAAKESVLAGDLASSNLPSITSRAVLIVLVVLGLIGLVFGPVMAIGAHLSGASRAADKPDFIGRLRESLRR